MTKSCKISFLIATNIKKNINIFLTKRIAEILSQRNAYIYAPLTNYFTGCCGNVFHVLLVL